jgi:hypothetical protein
LKNENNGVMVHITRMFGEDEIPPANEEESINNENTELMYIELKSSVNEDFYIRKYINVLKIH